MTIRLEIASVQDMHALGRDLARLSRAGDLILVIGELGAGKTQLAQGIGEGLHVMGPVISPTFVISRIHRSLDDGPALVHVDTYRLASRDEIDDLDLDEEMPHSITVIEWGRGLAEQLSEDRLEVEIQRSGDPEDETRHVTVIPIGQRWADLVPQWEALINVNMGRDALADAMGDGDD
ncbi:MAG: tRNA (adenosine(37)-N6)-threonylcarbamoyltransferase complex ATPase subunit type 1 TsaE [Propionibacteriaceae bacterium]|nr:tRNA (adenosine(37)-N6)-threonylcarbamoyltransferase complex ATPase subunit type 1 TsaE [Propionibacteriaceae bacterium]